MNRARLRACARARKRIQAATAGLDKRERIVVLCGLLASWSAKYLLVSEGADQGADQGADRSTPSSEDQRMFFQYYWCDLSQRGACGSGSYSGAECERVFGKWAQAGYPAGIASFIRSNILK